MSERWRCAYCEDNGKLILRIHGHHLRLHGLVGEGEGGDDDDAIAGQKVPLGGTVGDDVPHAEV